MNDNFPVCCCIIKDDKVIRRCKVHAEEIEFLGKQLYVLKEGYAIKSRELDFLEVDKTELLKALNEIAECKYRQIIDPPGKPYAYEIAQEAVEKYGGEEEITQAHKTTYSEGILQKLSNDKSKE